MGSLLNRGSCILLAQLWAGHRRNSQILASAFVCLKKFVMFLCSRVLCIYWIWVFFKDCFYWHIAVITEPRKRNWAWRSLYQKDWGLTQSLNGWEVPLKWPLAGWDWPSEPFRGFEYLWGWQCLFKWRNMIKYYSRCSNPIVQNKDKFWLLR